jgi:hypothetical protein
MDAESLEPAPAWPALRQVGGNHGAHCDVQDVDVATAETGAADEAAPTIYDCQPDPDAKVDVRRLPGVAREALRIVGAASRLELALVVTLQILGALGVVVLLLLGNQALQAVAAIEREDGSVADVLPWALALAGVAAAQLFVAAVLRERQQILGELVGRHVDERVLDIAAAEVRAFGLAPYLRGRYERLYDER